MRLTNAAAASCVLFLSLANTVTADEIIYPGEPESIGVIDSYEPGNLYPSPETIGSPGCGVVQEGCNACGAGSGCSICNGGGAVCGGCNTCAPPACGVCGTAQCWDCSHEEGIDIDSLTVAAQSKALYEASRARIIVICPEATGVSLMDQKMTTLGELRSFLVDVNDRDKVYKYEIKVDVVRGGKKYFKKHKMDNLRAGMILTVVVEAPPYEEGAPVVLALDVKPDAPGGKPPEEKKDEDGGDDEKKDGEDDKSAPTVASQKGLKIPAIR
ncbi:MAG: hypothetical protein KDB01_22980 [Planctomycetaceae bacterium]|nr:hypothetical protein [Planctomycetaceae bacterium]